MTAPLRPWAALPERGSAFFVALGLHLVLALGWRFGRVLLLGITGWFVGTSPAARAASRDYLARALGRPARAWDVVRHFHAFGASVLDTPFLVAGRTGRFRVDVDGLEQLERILAEGRGCVLLGSHLGSFAVLRHVARGSPVPVRPLMFRRNDGVLSRLLDRLDPAAAGRVIDIGAPESLLVAREALAKGEILGVLGDRDPQGGRAVSVPFLGEPAPLPAGPMQLVAALGAPVVLFRAVCVGPRHYAVRFAPFADRLVLRRDHRAADLRAALGRFAAFIEAGCRAHPFQWFNFYPFWEGATDANEAAPAAPAADRRQPVPTTGGRRVA